MPVQKDPSGRRSVTAETEVPGTPEEVWQAIATGPGLTAWFVPSELEERKNGAITMHFGPGMDSHAEILEWEPPHRFLAENSQGMGPGSPAMATEWIVEARSGGTCTVRVVHSWFASTDDWDDQYQAAENGWPGFFRILNRYLRHFRGQRCTQLQLVATADGPESAAWDRLTSGLGLSGAQTGTAVRSPAGAPRLAGTVENAGPKSQITLALDEPAPGTAEMSLIPMGEQFWAYVCLYLYGGDAPAVAAREEPVWRAWLDRQFPPA